MWTNGENQTFCKTRSCCVRRDWSFKRLNNKVTNKAKHATQKCVWVKMFNIECKMILRLQYVQKLRLYFCYFLLPWINIAYRTVHKVRFTMNLYYKCDITMRSSKTNFSFFYLLIITICLFKHTVQKNLLSFCSLFAVLSSRVSFLSAFYLLDLQL